MHIKLFTAADAELWDRYVDQHPESTFFHRSGWKRVIENSTGHPGSYLIAFKNERVAGIYPFFILSTGLFGKMGFSLPFVNYGGVLSDDQRTEEILLNEAEKIARAADCHYIELHQRYPLKSRLPTSEHKVASVIPLNGGAESVFSRLHQNVRNKIRKANKNGITVQKGIEYVDDFYDVYARNLRDLGTPVISRSFFENILEAFPDNVAVFRASRQGKTIGAKITLLDTSTCYFEWSASRRDSLRYAPVHAMNWAAIENACASGCKKIDFGRSTAESSHQNFKKYWAVETQTMSWAYQLLTCNEIPGLNKENPKFSLAISMWKKMPLFLSRVIGPPIARRLP